MEVNRKREFVDVLNSPECRKSVLQPCLNKFTADRVIHISCSELEHLDSGRGLGFRHLGTYDDLIRQVVQYSLIAMEAIFNTFWIKLLSMNIAFLEDDDGLALLLWCTWGKHRSVAVGSIFCYCLDRDNWKLCCKNGEISLLNCEFYGYDSCGKRNCRYCDEPIRGRKSRWLEMAYAKWVEGKNKRLRNLHFQ